MKSKNCEGCRLVETTYSSFDICFHCVSKDGSIHATTMVNTVPFTVIYEGEIKEPKYCPHCGEKL